MGYQICGKEARKLDQQWHATVNKVNARFALEINMT